LRARINPNVRVTGTGSAVGDRVLDNDALEPLVHGYDAARSGPFGAWVDQVTHIHERPLVSPGVRTSDLALVASRQALAAAGIGPKDLGLILYASFTMSETVPGDHCLLARDLGAPTCPTLNLMGACAGSVYGLAMAYGLIASNVYRHVLVVGSETISPVVNFHDPLTAILFADGAGAAVVSRADDDAPGGMLPPQLAFEYSPGAIKVPNSNNPHEGLRCAPGLPDRPGRGLVERSLIEMNGGPSVLKNAIHHMAQCTVRTLGYEIADLKAHEPTLRALLDRARLVPHQANGRIVDGLADRLGMAPARVMRTVYRYGNMSAASNLVALDHGLRKGNLERRLDADGRVLSVETTPQDRIQKGDLVLMPSIGGGYLMGCIGFVQAYDGPDSPP
jgi:3-oxoacyl-[acyl-carrier-protein] synthase-3